MERKPVKGTGEGVGDWRPSGLEGSRHEWVEGVPDLKVPLSGERCGRVTHEDGPTLERSLIRT